MLAIAGGAAPAAAAQPDAREVARAYLAENAQKFGVTRADFADLMFTSVYETKGLGVTHVNINQRYRDMEVFGGQITVNVDADGKVVFAGGAAGQPGERRLRRAEPRRHRRGGQGRARAQARARRRSCACCAAPAPSRRRPSSRAAGSRARRSRPRSAGSRPRAASGSPGARSSTSPTTRICGTPPSTPRPARCSTRTTGPRTTTLDELKARLQRSQRAPAGAGLPARVPGQLARAGARRLGLPRLRVAEREPARRRPHAGLQPGGLDRLAVRLA